MEKKVFLVETNLLYGFGYVVDQQACVVEANYNKETNRAEVIAPEAFKRL